MTSVTIPGTGSSRLLRRSATRPIFNLRTQIRDALVSASAAGRLNVTTTASLNVPGPPRLRRRARSMNSSSPPAVTTLYRQDQRVHPITSWSSTVLRR